jgi:hypothetical protein
MATLSFGPTAIPACSGWHRQSLTSAEENAAHRYRERDASSAVRASGKTVTQSQKQSVRGSRPLAASTGPTTQRRRSSRALPVRYRASWIVTRW